MTLQRLAKRIGCLAPNLVCSYRLVWVTRGKFELKIFKTELAQNRQDKVEQRSYFVCHLVFRAKNVTVVLSESTNAQQSVQRSGPFVPIYSAKLEKAKWKFAIAALAVTVDETVHRAIHRLRVIGAVVHLHRWIHAVFIKMQVSRSFEQFGVRNMRRKHELVTTRLVAMAAVVLHQLADDRALWVPNCQPAAQFLRKRKQIHFDCKFSMVALLCFGKASDVLFKRRLGLPCSAVDALQHRAFFVATPIGASNLHQRKVAKR